MLRNGPARWLYLVVALALAAGFLAAAPPPASAVQQGTQSVVVSDNPIRTTPHVLDGYVSGFAQVGDIVVVVGNFTTVRTAADTTEIPRTNIFAFKFSTGEITSFAPAVNGELMDVEATGDGKTVWIAGGFSSLNGETVRGVAKIDVTTGQRDPSFAVNAFDGRVNQVMLSNGKLYVTGRFLNVNGKPQTSFAGLDPATGVVLPDVRLDLSGPRNGGALSIMRADITADGSKMVAIGNFTSVNGLSRTQVFVADLTTSPTSVANWSTERFVPLCHATSFDSYVRDISISPDGTYFVIVATGAYYAGTMCDAASAWDLKATGGSLQPKWVDYTGGDTTNRVAVTNTAVYIGGHFSYLNNPFIGDAVGPGAVEREGLAALDPRTGLPLAWNPGRTRGVGVYSFVATDTGLWIGSDTDRISNYQYHGRMAFMPVGGGTNLPLDNSGSLPADVYVVGAAKDDSGAAVTSTSLVKRSFSGAAVTASRTMNVGQSFSDTRGAFMIDGNLFTAHADGTFRMQSFDGTTLGAQTTINLNGLTAFASEMKQMTGLFYDPATSRIYFTLQNDGHLYYRYYGTQATIVGAERYTAGANLSGLDWRAVRSLFLSGSTLYVGDSTGTLSRWAWDSASGLPSAGTRATVSGASVDGINWSARDAFLFAGPTKPGPATASDPSAAFTSSLSSRTLAVDATSSTASAPLSSFAWDFGDGAKASGRTASHAYAALGTYTVKLTLTDAKGRSASTARVVRISNDLTATGTVAPSDAYGSAVYNISPTLYWRLGEKSGTAAADSSASNKPGTYRSGVTLGTAGALAGVSDTAGTFNGSNGLVSSNSSFVNPTVYSTEIWFKTTTKTGGELISFGNAATGTSTTHDRKVYMQNDGTLVFGVYTGSRVLVTTAKAYNNGAWHHVVATQSSAGMRLYVDGALAGQNSTTAAQNYTGYWRVGGDKAWANVTTPYISGVLDEAAVYPYALSADTVAEHYNLGAGTNSAPTAAFSTAGSYLDVQADGSASTDTDGTISSYAWTFGDGTTGTGVLASHSYAAAGTYTVTLKVTDNRGGTGTVSRQVTVSDRAANSAPTASFTASAKDLAVQFDGTGSSDSDGTVSAYAWKFGDGATGQGATASHSYSAAGSYQVTLTVTDDAGATGALTKTVSVTAPAANQAPTAKFSASTAGLSVDVDGSASTDADGTVAAYAWDFGDGAKATGVKASHSYAAAGTYTVKLTATDDAGATGTTSQAVTVAAPSAAAVSFRSGAQTNVNSTAPTVTVPSDVAAGDALLLIATVNTTSSTAADPTGVTGWRLVDSKAAGTMQTVLWVKTAAAGDAGKALTVPLSAIAKVSLQLAAYHGITGPNWLATSASAIDQTLGTSHSTPQVTVPAAGSTLVSFWADKTSVDDSWTLDPRVTVRGTTGGTGGGQLVTAFGDTAPVSAGAAGNLAATLGTASAKVALWSIVLQPGS
ncbi:PKD domain-containing protein [Paenarthrobacter sp. DKR-5]|uniref:PKD domain-containing protein n=1 Tax=Paenarthrobacter sp. DKR-5 TaxID=2835535 RepID=UPI001BDD6812|nr:PKD domain-containing protein [Paenarthrobacter sp. DKR-5]MBT1002474.1 PKD domain-containing protein [Paenarthrobacter sp. DKR-5]